MGQAGFRKGYSTTDHIQTLRLLIEKANEYNIDIHLAFIDYKKAFDSIEHWAIMHSLDNARVDSRYTGLLKSIYATAKMSIRVDEDQKIEDIEVKKGVRQGDTISPKLFTLALEDVFKILDWEGIGIRVNGEYLHHLRFADDAVLISEDPDELKVMIQHDP